MDPQKDAVPPSSRTDLGSSANIGGTNGRKEQSLRRQSVAPETTLADLGSLLFTLLETPCQFATQPFGVLGLVLAAVGLYGVMAYTVEQRTNEIGVRMALGADRASVVGMVLGSAFFQIGIGIGLGIPLAIVAGRLMTRQLFGISP